MAACDEKDPRLPWINERVTVGLKLKSDRFMKMATSEVDGPPLRDFLDTPDIMRIFFVDGAKEMYCYPVPPASTKIAIIKDHQLLLTSFLVAASGSKIQP